MHRPHFPTILALIFCLAISSLSFAQDSKKSFTLVIDAGHGGHDPGACGAFAQEKTINLNVALEFGNLVKKNCPDVKVIYTRSKDVFIPLQQRANIANRNKADLFISIHTNAAAKGHSVYGTETYTLGIARANSNLEVAKRENSVITYEKNYQQTYEGFDPNKVESYIIFELMQDKYMQQSVEMAKLVQQQFTHTGGRKNKGVHQAGFLVLRQTSMPSILTELGFISNRNEEKFLASPEGVTTMSRCLYNAFVKYRKTQAPSYQAPLLAKQEVKKEEKQEAKQAIQQNSSNTEKVVAEATKEKTAKKEDVPSVRRVCTESKKAQQEKLKAEQERLQAEEKARIAKEEELKQVADIQQTDPKKPIFKWQITVNMKKLEANSPEFKGLQGVESYFEDKMHKYTYGASNSYEEVKKMGKEIKQKFPQAFIVAFVDGKRANLYQAIQLAKKK